MKTEEMSFQVSLENCQGVSILDRGGKLISPARNNQTPLSLDSLGSRTGSGSVVDFLGSRTAVSQPGHTNRTVTRG